MELSLKQTIISVVLKLIVIISAITGIIISAVHSSSAFMGVVWWILLLLGLLIGLGFLYLKIIDLLEKRKNKNI